jgi:hypothetical protein
VAIGLALMPVVLLKVGSTGWRLVKYDRTDRACSRRGAFPAYLRILRPVLIASTVVLVASGMLVGAAVLAVVLAAPAGDYLHLYPLHYWRAGGS